VTTSTATPRPIAAPTPTRAQLRYRPSRFLRSRLRDRPRCLPSFPSPTPSSCSPPSPACRRPASGPSSFAWAACQIYPASRGRGVQREAVDPPSSKAQALRAILGRRRGGGRCRQRSTCGDQRVDFNTWRSTPPKSNVRTSCTTASSPILMNYVSSPPLGPPRFRAHADPSGERVLSCARTPDDASG
jgi:hypothetical protein